MSTYPASGPCMLDSTRFFVDCRVLVRCSDLVGEQAVAIKGLLRDALQEAKLHAPSLVIFDDLDVLLPGAESEGPEPAVAVVSMAEYLADLIDMSQVRHLV
jgi:peroxin-1